MESFFMTSVQISTPVRTGFLRFSTLAVRCFSISVLRAGAIAGVSFGCINGASAQTAAAPAVGFVQIGIGKTFTSASIGSANNYGAITGGQFTAWNGTSWVPSGVALSQVATGSDGERWGITSTGEVYHYYRSSWQLKYSAPALKQISVGSAAYVWGLNSVGRIGKWNGLNWLLVEGIFASVSIGADGTAFGVKADDTVWRWTGVHWVQIGGLLRQISVGSGTNTWGLQSDGAIWKLNGAMTGWDIQRQVPPGSYIGVSAAADGSVLLVRSDGTLWKK